MRARSIFLSGGAGGIGLVTARRFAAAGWRVGIGDIDTAAAACAAADGGIVPFALDVRDMASWESALDIFCAPDDGALDILVNNAGVLDFGWFDEQPADSFRRAVDVNVIGVMNGARAGIARLRRGIDPCLVNIASSAALEAAPRLAVYSATKFAVRGLSEALDFEFGRLGVRVACIEPFLVDTPMLDRDDPSGRRYRAAMQGQAILSAEDVAAIIWEAVRGRALHYPVGAAPEQLAAPLVAQVEERRARWAALRSRQDQAAEHMAH